MHNSSGISLDDIPPTGPPGTQKPLGNAQSSLVKKDKGQPLSQLPLFPGVHVTVAKAQELKPKKTPFKYGPKCNSEQHETRKKSSCKPVLCDCKNTNTRHGEENTLLVAHADALGKGREPIPT